MVSIDLSKIRKINIDKEKKVTVHVMNGGAPEKINYFSTRCKDNIKSIIYDNRGDDCNAYNLTELKKKYPILGDNYIQITSEYQLAFISSNKEMLKWYNDNIDNFIHLKTRKMMLGFDKPDALTNKYDTFKQLPNLGKGVKLIKGSDILIMSKEDRKNMVVKKVMGTGAGGVLFYEKVGSIKTAEPDPELMYMTQPLYPKSWIFMSILINVHNGKLSTYIPELCKAEDYCSSKWHNYQITGKYNKFLLPAVEELIKYLQLYEGCMEPEFFIDPNTGDVRIVDLNPRWSYSDAIITKILNENGFKKFDMMKSILYGNKLIIKDDYESPWYKLTETFVKNEVQY